MFASPMMCLCILPCRLVEPITIAQVRLGEVVDLSELRRVGSLARVFLLVVMLNLVLIDLFSAEAAEFKCG